MNANFIVLTANTLNQFPEFINLSNQEFIIHCDKISNRNNNNDTNDILCRIDNNQQTLFTYLKYQNRDLEYQRRYL